MLGRRPGCRTGSGAAWRRGRSRSSSLGRPPGLVVAQDEGAVRPPVDAVDLAGDPQRPAVAEVDRERLLRWGSPGAPSRADAEADLEVGGDGVARGGGLALQPLQHRGVELRALPLPEDREPRRAARHQGVEPLVGQRQQPGARLRRVADGQLRRGRAARAGTAPPPRGRCCRARAGSSRLRSSGSCAGSSRRTYWSRYRNPQRENAARRLAEMGRSAVTGSSLRRPPPRRRRPRRRAARRRRGRRRA